MGIRLRYYGRALIAITTGASFQRELRDRLKNTHPGCLYYHFWAGLLRPYFVDPEFQNDFAIWASRNLHDSKISEQLSIIDANVFKDIEDLRKEIVEVIDERLSESEHVPWVKTGQEFQFIRSDSDFGNSVIYGIQDLIAAIPICWEAYFSFIDSAAEHGK
jgi:hypothetical protein